MNITAKMQVVVDEITLDVTDFLRTLIGQNNDDITRTVITLSLEKYLANLEEVMVYQVVCDDSNNPPENVDNGRLAVDILFVVDHISMRGNFNIEPGVSHYADINHEFFVRVNKADLQVLQEANDAEAAYAEMPVALASTLGY